MGDNWWGALLLSELRRTSEAPLPHGLVSVYVGLTCPDGSWTLRVMVGEAEVLAVDLEGALTIDQAGVQSLARFVSAQMLDTGALRHGRELKQLPPDDAPPTG